MYSELIVCLLYKQSIFDAFIYDITFLNLFLPVAYRTESVAELMEWPKSSFSIIKDLEWIFEGINLTVIF